MMKYHIGDMITCQTEIRKNNYKYVLVREPLKNSVLGQGRFQIVAVNNILRTYTIIIDDDMIGWSVSKFHIEHFGIPAIFNGKKFFDVTEQFILE